MKQRDQRKQPGKPKPLGRKLHINGEEWSCRIMHGPGLSWTGRSWAGEVLIRDPQHRDLGKHTIHVDRDKNVSTHPLGEDSTYWAIYPSDVKTYIETNLVGA